MIFLQLMILTLCIHAKAQIPTDNLEAYYPFNGNADDASGNGNDGISYGATIANDRFGNTSSAYYFDGINDYINTNTFFDFQERSVSFWAKSNVINGSGVNSCGAIWQDHYINNYGVIQANFVDNVLQLDAGGSAPYYYANISTNTWIHIVLVRTADFTKYYVDGLLVATEASGDLGSTINPYNSFVIGTDRTLSQRFFDGTVDDIRIYSDAVTQCEVLALFNEGGGGLFDLGITQAGNVLTSNDINATYQWMDCSDSTIISGEISQTFVAPPIGNFAVILNNGICSDTSTCVSVTEAGIIENNFGINFRLYPNPTNGDFFVDLDQTYQNVEITLKDLNNRDIFSKRINNGKLLNLKINEPSGVYLLIIQSGAKKAIVRLVKE